MACLLAFWNKLSQTDNLPLQFTYHLTLTASVYLSVKPVKYKNDIKKAVKIIRKATKIVIIAGGGIKYTNKYVHNKSLMEKF